MRNTMRTWLGCAALSLAMSVPALAVDIRSGTNSFPVGQQGMTVTFSPPVSGPNAQVIVQPAATSNFSTVSECVYFNVLDVTASSFAVQLKTCKDGTLVKTQNSITMLWFLIHQ
jgi:hypothetical protein